MSESNKEKFESDWQKAFEDAELEPSAHVWAGIEESMPVRKFSFWHKSTLIFCSIMMAILLYRGVNDPRTDTVISENEKIKSNSERNISSLENDSVASHNQAISMESSKKNQNKSYDNQAITLKSIEKSSTTTNTTPKAPAQIFIPKNENPPTDIKSNHFIQNQPTILNTNPNLELSPSVVIIDTDTANSKNFNDSYKSNTFNALSPVKLSQASSSFKQTDLVISNQASYNINPNTLQSKRFWIGLQTGVYYFNPNTRTRYQEYLNDYITSHQLNNVIVTDFFDTANERQNLGIGLQIGLQFGWQFSKHWQIRTGIGYIRQNSQQRSNTFFVNRSDGNHHSILANIYSNDMKNRNLVNAITSHPTYNSAINNQFSLEQLNEASSVRIQNQSQFLSLPIQFGYTFMPLSKIRLTVLAGGNADIFLGNEVKGDFIHNDTKATPQNNQVFRKLSLSASLGLDFSWKYSDKLSLSLMPILRRNLNSTVNSTYLQSKPEMSGIEFGLRYSF
jgi:Outer membrane protein beta-barrel domain